MADDNDLDLRVELRGDPDLGIPAFSVPAHEFWDAYEAITRAGIDGALRLAAATSWLLTNGEHPLTQDEAQRLRNFFDRIEDIGKQWTSREEFVLGFTYEQLHAKKITREQAAKLASRVLKKPYTTDAFRVKLDRWAEHPSRRLPKVGIRKRQKP